MFNGQWKNRDKVTVREAHTLTNTKKSITYDP